MWRTILGRHHHDWGIVAGVRVVAREEDERGVPGAQRAPVDDAGDERAESVLQPVEAVPAESDLLDGAERQAECQHDPECRRVGQDCPDDGDPSVTPSAIAAPAVTGSMTGQNTRTTTHHCTEIRPHVDEPSTQVIDPFLATGEPGHRETGEQRTRPTE